MVDVIAFAAAAGLFLVEVIVAVVLMRVVVLAVVLVVALVPKASGQGLPAC